MNRRLVAYDTGDFALDMRKRRSGSVGDGGWHGGWHVFARSDSFWGVFFGFEVFEVVCVV